MAYSLDLRERAISCYDSKEGSQLEIAEYFGVSLSTFKRWIGRKRNGETLRPKKGKQGRPKKIDDFGIETLRAAIEENSTITLSELSDLYFKRHNITVGTSVLSRAINHLNLRYKKLSIKAAEKEKEVVKKKRRISRNNT